MPRAQLVTIAAAATSFTTVCETCLALDTAVGWSSSTFAGRLDLDVREATFLCRRGHAVRVARPEPHAQDDDATAAA
jgi:hypothetical protein